MALRDVVFTLLAAVIILGMATVGCAEENNITYKEEKHLILKYDQKVSGTGFFSTYKYAFMPDALGPTGAMFNGAETKSKNHGSGTIDTDSNMYAESYHLYENYSDTKYDEYGQPYDDFEDANSIIQLKEDGKMAYSPLSMAIDSQYYNIHPVIFNSLLKDDAWIKNRDNLNSMNYMTEGAHELDRMLDIQADYSSTVMTVNESLTNGKIHFGVLELKGIPVDEVPEEMSEEESLPLGLAMKAWEKPLTVVDEDYIGTFNITKRMTLTTLSVDVENEEDRWLPCCGSYGGNGGWDDMNATDKKGFGASTEGMFDCSCFKVPDKTQFSG